MKIQKAICYVGPNRIAPVPLAHLQILIEGAENWPTDDSGHGCTDRLLALLPGLSSHPDLQGNPGNFVRTLRAAPGAPLCFVAARVAAELLHLHHGKVRPAGIIDRPDGRTIDIFFGYRDPDIALLAGRTAVNIVLSLLPPEQRPVDSLPASFQLDAAIPAFARVTGRMALDQTTLALVEGAENRGVPWFILDREKRIVQLGQGRHLRRIRESVTDTTPAISTWIQRDKASTNRLFAEVHLPVPRQARVVDPEAAVRAAQAFGFPVVIKPLDSSKGLGISTKLRDADAVRSAFEQARRHSPQVLVERFIPGDDHRILVVGGELVAAAKRFPAAVRGDGRHSIQQLVEDTNKDPRRGVGFTELMNQIVLDEHADNLLQAHGYTRESVPPPGKAVVLRSTANISTGGTAVDVTDCVHPENRWMLERAARVSGLDVVGIDFITPDIAQSYRQVGGAICEINTSPGLRPHQIAEGDKRDVVESILDALFANKRNGRIPIAAITGTNGKTTTSRMLAHILRYAGGDIGIRTVGLVTTDGVHVDGKLVAKGDFAGATGARVLLHDPLVDAAVLETARGGIVKGGMGFDWCDVGAVLNVTDDHVGIDGIDSIDEMAVIKGRVAEAARKLAVLNADDPRCLGLCEKQAADKVCLITAGIITPALQVHLESGGLVISLEEDAGGPGIVLHKSEARNVIAPLSRIPATWGGAARYNLQNAMAAAALAIGLGVPIARIAPALEQFKNDHHYNPGRLNVYDGHPFKVILDSAHNPDGVRLVCDAVRPIAAKGRRIGVFIGVGNRHGEHIGEIAGIIADDFDIFVCSRLQKLSDEREASRGFPSQEIPKRLAAALIARDVDPSKVMVVDIDRDAIDHALSLAKAGDLLVFLVGTASWVWDQIVAYKP